MFFSISFSSFSSSSLILEPNSAFSCWLPMSFTFTLSSFRNTSHLFHWNLKIISHLHLLLRVTRPCRLASILLCISSSSSFVKLVFYLTLLIHKPLFNYIKHTNVPPCCMHSLSIPINFWFAPVIAFLYYPFSFSVSTFFKSSSQAVYYLYQN